ncbi:g7 [Coccomyxa elongata]
MLTATSVAAFNDIVREGATGLCLVAVGPRAQPKGWNIPLPLARSVAARRFYANIKQLPLSSMDSINRIDAAIDALQEDIKDHLKTALCSIADRTDNLKKRKEPPTVTQSEARKAIRDLVRLKRMVTGVDSGHPRNALASLGVVPGEDNDPTASICPVCMERRATRVVLGSCGHTVCAKCVISNPVAKCPVCRGNISFLMRVF